MNELFLSPDECLRRAADQLFASAKHFRETAYEHLIALTGGRCGRSAFRRVFPGDEFRHRRHAWLQERIEQAMEMAFAEAKFPNDVTFQQLADLAGCSVKSVERL